MEFTLLTPSHVLTVPHEVASPVSSEGTVSMASTEDWPLSDDQPTDEPMLSPAPDVEPVALDEPVAADEAVIVPANEPVAADEAVLLPANEPMSPTDKPPTDSEQILLLFYDNSQMYVRTNAVMEIFPDEEGMHDTKKELLRAKKDVTITVGDATHVVHFVIKHAVILAQKQSMLYMLLKVQEEEMPDQEVKIQLTNENTRLYPIVFKHMNNLFAGIVHYMRTKDESDMREIQERICNFLQIEPMPETNAKQLQKLIESILTITDNDVDKPVLQSTVYTAFVAKTTERSELELTKSKFYNWLREHGARNIKTRKQMYYTNVLLVQ
jgi:hypothetical protein